ncbi:similar to Saccharomyces cerevisiae YNL158W PGA1 Essential component of GPI- mannosyltransferase II, responsible for second mannose addition to GPI precursors as a partner of Gpi18p [Maudiozyma barnettii]|uniref:Similar to Saccharomyces cerevisiae YNL158W PGA1 Essential component of GPI- mannosyltransferase II, responsible for second mannose addition to GPIs as a partner of Gpi18p n=1 Tax=Maudiozyma barnettii TaxID=61262 RepID=A0A8H2ZH31_9SACH|nr:Pga1p [Kazachstania barnettii]CAB4254333.1 similar to Saccharomyces cerevisiae YNL158W PGA1 Essential component of GPI- mannosyltransferase II, responsible for second mannose addition to GPI precursors as a partner of Gpi18p [Kazachstania barnettii]CAD1782177.1 similar to Saccharomyces cerevisiae YNL158W PGA1 Essential component of GPI- mannosyltransferase II, responsible for second mannose addition to GPI precursors as a partner of Gpi18p [Kazachstania barnettii]
MILRHHNISFTWLLLLLLTNFLCVFANTETFQVALPSGAALKSVGVLFKPTVTDDLTIWSVDITSNLRDLQPIVLNLVYNSDEYDEYDLQLYSFKICWSAITPISYKSQSFTVNHTNLTSTNEVAYDISFMFESDSYPPIEHQSPIMINCSISKLIWGVLPSELLPTLFMILIVLISTISFYKVYRHIPIL